MAGKSLEPLPPLRPDLVALLDAVKDHPDDDTPRLVLADWLDEQDNPLDAERAAFIRRHIADSCGPHRWPSPDHVRPEDHNLLDRWLEPFADFKTGWSFVRG